VPFLFGKKGENRLSPPPGIMDELGPASPTLAALISPNRAQRDLFAQKREFGYDVPPSPTSLNTGASTPKDLEVRNVFDEELGSVPKIRRKPMLGVHNYS
jgi:hypothetical protein